MRFSRCQDKPGAPVVTAWRLSSYTTHWLITYFTRSIAEPSLSRSFQFRGSVPYSMGKTSQAAAVYFSFAREFNLLCTPPGNFCEFYTIWLDAKATVCKDVRTKQTSNASRATVNRSRTDAQDLQFSPFQSSSLQPMHKLSIHMRQLCEVRQRFADRVARTWPLCPCAFCRCNPHVSSIPKAVHTQSLADFLSPPYPLQNSSSATLVVSAPLGRSLPPVGRPVKSMCGQPAVLAAHDGPFRPLRARRCRRDTCAFRRPY